MPGKVLKNRPIIMVLHDMYWKFIEKVLLFQPFMMIIGMAPLSHYNLSIHINLFYLCVCIPIHLHTLSNVIWI